MKDKKLIRGIIYDNPDEIENTAVDTATGISILVDNATQNISEFDFNECPNRDEFFTSLGMMGMINPYKNSENLLIPAELLDEKLYKQLKKIDIGGKVLQMFMNTRVNNYTDKISLEDKTEDEPEFFIKYNDKGTRYPVKLSYSNKDEAVDGIIDLYNNGVINEKICNELLTIIEAA